MKSYDPIGNHALITDSYKPSHFLQYPPDTKALYAYLEARKGARYSHSLWFGLQYILDHYFPNNDHPVTEESVLQAAEFWKMHGEPFNVDGWMKIVNEHSGCFPLRIRAPKEGTLVPIDHPLMTVESTDPDLWWLVTYIETVLMRVWYPTTVATRSFFCKQVIRKYLELTSDNPDAEINFKLHDFGGRGVSSDESAGVGAMAHLVNFLGTDTVEGITMANLFYPAHWSDADGEEDFKMHGFSIPAMEHSTVISWGGPQFEINAFRNMLRQHKERGHKMVACVSDSYDLFNAVENIWGSQLLQEVKDSGMTVVIRPDSGDPVEVNKEILRILARKLGSEMKVNSKGYVVLPDYYRIIQGDGNDDETSIERVLKGISEAGFSASNIAFGMGGGLLQKLDRDTLRFAYKVSSINRDGSWRDVKKTPKTDASKSSKGGRVELAVNADNDFVTVDLDRLDRKNPTNFEAWDYEGEQPVNLPMVTYYDDGYVKVGEQFEDVRARAATQRVR